VARCPEAKPGCIEGHVNGLVLAPKCPISPPAPATAADGTGWLGLRFHFSPFPCLLILLAFVTLEHSYHRKGLAVDINGVTNRHDLVSHLFRGTEQIVSNSRTDNADGVGIF